MWHKESWGCLQERMSPLCAQFWGMLQGDTGRGCGWEGRLMLTGEGVNGQQGGLPGGMCRLLQHPGRLCPAVCRDLAMA